MSGNVLQGKVRITDPQGLHLRPLALFADLARTFPCNVAIVKDGERVNGKSSLELMMLAAVQGTELIVEVSGPDAEKALPALVQLLEHPPTDPEETSAPENA